MKIKSGRRAHLLAVHFFFSPSTDCFFFLHNVSWQTVKYPRSHTCVCMHLHPRAAMVCRDIAKAGLPEAVVKLQLTQADCLCVASLRRQQQLNSTHLLPLCWYWFNVVSDKQMTSELFEFKWLKMLMTLSNKKHKPDNGDVVSLMFYINTQRQDFVECMCVSFSCEAAVLRVIVILMRYW